MRGNSFGKMITMTSFGESHGPSMGVVLDGIPSKLEFSREELIRTLKRRAPGIVEGTTSRKEADDPIVLSGIFENITLGTPICVLIENTNQKSNDYNELKDNFRPGHADKTTLDKFGIRDHRGGGRSSGRETVSRVIAGYFAGLIIPQIKVKSFSSQLGPFKISQNISEFSPDSDFGPYGFPNLDKTEEIKAFLLDLKNKGESIGGIVTTIIDHVPAGLGEPVFDKLKADLAKAIMSIGGVVAFSFGLGTEMADLMGGQVSTDKNNFGGIEGGISNGERMILHCVFKPTSTIGKNAKDGRHDPCIIPRAIVVVESMVKFVLADHYLRQNAYRENR